MSELQEPGDRPVTLADHQFLVLAVLRLYDVMMAQLRLQNVELAKYVESAHAAGQIIGPNLWVDSADDTPAPEEPQ